MLISVLLLHLNPAAMHWTSDLRENIARSVAPGAANDPRPAHRGGVDFANLQAITSIFFADPKMFNLAAYVIFLIALAVFIVATLKTDVNADSDRQIHYAAIASLSAISLLPVYHRVYDARVLLLAIPAIVVVHQRQRLLGMILAVVAIFQVLSMYTQGLVLSFFENRGEMPHLLQNKLLFLLTMRQGAYAVLILAVLLLSSMFFIGRSTSRPAES
ncbi:MAG: hypothetical protein JO300_10010 [Silvibacterium sp.]|nr:hypothetical protein [Silvibacterium sp.]